VEVPLEKHREINSVEALFSSVEGVNTTNAIYLVYTLKYDWLLREAKSFI
jgi:hypothetical protein